MLDDDADLHDCRGYGAGCDLHRRLSVLLKQLFGIDSVNAMVLQQDFQDIFTELRCIFWHRRQLSQFEGSKHRPADCGTSRNCG